MYIDVCMCMYVFSSKIFKCIYVYVYTVNMYIYANVCVHMNTYIYILMKSRDISISGYRPRDSNPGFRGNLR